MAKSKSLILQASCVAIEGRALAIEGPPGSGKSSLALALIDRGATLIGDDAVTLSRVGNRLIAAPPPNIEGLVEVRGVGLATLALGDPAPLALILTLGEPQARLPEGPEQRTILQAQVPCLAFAPGAIIPALRAEWALTMHGARL